MATRKVAASTDIGFIVVVGADDGVFNAEGQFVKTRQEALDAILEELERNSYEYGPDGYMDPDDSIALFKIKASGDIICESFKITRGGWEVS